MQTIVKKHVIKVKRFKYNQKILLNLKKYNFNKYVLIKNKLVFIKFNKKPIFWNSINLKYKNTKSLLLNSSFLKLKFLKNNIFFIFKNKLKQKSAVVENAGKYKLSITKKSSKFKSNIFFKHIFKKILTFKPTNKKQALNLYLKLSVFKKAKKPVLAKIKTFFKKYKNKNIMLDLESKKCFNGCRPLKKKRHRHKGLRIFK